MFALLSTYPNQGRDGLALSRRWWMHAKAPVPAAAPVVPLRLGMQFECPSWRFLGTSPRSSLRDKIATTDFLQAATLKCLEQTSRVKSQSMVKREPGAAPHDRSAVFGACSATWVLRSWSAQNFTADERINVDWTKQNKNKNDTSFIPQHWTCTRSTPLCRPSTMKRPHDGAAVDNEADVAKHV